VHAHQVEILGYAFRALAYNHTGQIMPYAVYAVMTLLAPALFAATIYMVLGRLARPVPQSRPLLIIPERYLTGVFVGGDILSFVVQGGGCGLMVMRDVQKIKVGEKIVVAGLIIQVLMFGLFGLVAALFQARLERRERARGSPSSAACRPVLYALYATSALIMTRSIFRLIEFIQGREGYLMQTEWPTLVLDGALMVLTMVVFFLWRPAKHINAIMHASSASQDSTSTSELQQVFAGKQLTT
jgi:hypothetical protein